MVSLTNDFNKSLFAVEAMKIDNQSFLVADALACFASKSKFDAALEDLNEKRQNFHPTRLAETYQSLKNFINALNDLRQNCDPATIARALGSEAIEKIKRWLSEIELPANIELPNFSLPSLEG
jgi:hypothetical protein